jgi:hypothetical protein
MKFTTVLISIGVLATCVAQAQPDSRFDGIWVGTETVTPVQVSWDPKAPKPPSRRAPTTIIIAQGSTLVGKIGGFCPGRFQHMWRTGNTVNFDAHNCKLNVSLSPDGKTLIENGSAAQATAYWVRSSTPARYRNFQISGTFHRQ